MKKDYIPDYIKELEVENAKLKDKVEQLQDKKDVVEIRNKKAIEYIESSVPCIHDEEILDDLAKILKGE